MLRMAMVSSYYELPGSRLNIEHRQFANVFSARDRYSYIPSSPDGMNRTPTPAPLFPGRLNQMIRVDGIDTAASRQLIQWQVKSNCYMTFNK